MSKKLKEIIYYLPIKSKQKKITIVLISDGTNFSRGVSVCSKKDQFNKKLGRTIATGRALKALIVKGSGPYNQISDQLNKLGFDNLSSFKPKLTEFELELADLAIDQ